jgi:sugar PTS system EIIA component
MFNFLKKKQLDILAPIEGTVIPLKEIRDPVFSGELMGKGFGIEPNENELVSPVAGKVASIFPTKHAILLETIRGVNVLIHIGIDTVELDGKGFSIMVEPGQSVSAGERLAIIDFDYVTLRGKETTVICVFPEFTGELAVNYQEVNKAEAFATICP